MSSLQTRDEDQSSYPSTHEYPYGEAEYLEWEDNAQYVKARPIGLRLLRAVVAVVILAAICVIGYGLARTWFGAQLDPDGDPGEALTLTIPAGATTGDIGGILEDRGVIPNGTFFRYYVQWRHGDEEFQAGEYTLAENMSADEAIEMLRVGPRQIEYGEFLVPEGLWVTEMVPRIAQQVPSVTAAELEAALASGQVTPRYRPDGNNNWDGLLFPAKYFVEEDITAAELVAKMNNEFSAVTGELGYGGAERKHGLSAYEVIIIASLVQAEAKTDADRPKIARVIYNRLRQGEPIGIDATYIYGAGDRQVALTTSILEEPGPYNSRDYDNPGLPPTPIGAPGRASLEAAMNPADGEWLWYVLADSDGNHFFTDVYDDFINQKNLSEEQGLLDG